MAINEQHHGVTPAGKAHEPERKCILSGDHAARHALIRLALGPGGEVLPDVRAKAPGRGAWIGVGREELAEAQAKGRLRGALARAFKTGDFALPDDLAGRVAEALERQALDRLGLEARAGTLLTGSERIREAAYRGDVRLLLHAADAAADGSRRLDQALRVGKEAEGSGLAGLVIPAPRPILSSALGRENVVHIAIVDERAAERVSSAVSRWMEFIGPGGRTEPCERDSQGPLGNDVEDKGQ